MDPDRESGQFENGRAIAILCCALIAGLFTWVWLGDPTIPVDGVLDWLQANARGHQ